MRAATCALMLLLLLALISSSAAAASTPPHHHRKMLTLNTASQVPRRYDSGTAQLAANNRAIVNTQLAIDAAYQSGANRYVNEAATNYGADQAWLASQATRRCGWYSGRWYPC